MPTAYTATLGLALPVTGELSDIWGDAINDEITQLVEDAVAGAVTIDSWTANAHTLTQGDGVTAEFRYAILNLTDTQTDLSDTAELIVPDINKLYTVINGTAQTVRVKTLSGTGFEIPAGERAALICDTVNVDAYNTIIDFNASEIATTPTVTLTSTTVQTALDELDTELQAVAAAVSSNIQNADEVPFVPTGNLFSADVQAALEELDTLQDAKVATDSAGSLTSLTIGSWVISESAGNLIFSNGVNRFSLTAAGNIVITGSVTEFGAP